MPRAPKKAVSKSLRTVRIRKEARSNRPKPTPLPMPAGTERGKPKPLPMPRGRPKPPLMDLNKAKRLPLTPAAQKKARTQIKKSLDKLGNYSKGKKKRRGRATSPGKKKAKRGY